MPPKSKTRNAAPNQHDKRHETGLAPPGKRVAKQRSSSNLNGHSNGRPVASAPAAVVPPPALPSTGLNQGLKFPRPIEPPHAALPTNGSSAVAATSTPTVNSSSLASSASSSPSAPSATHQQNAGVLAAAERARTSSDASVDEISIGGDMADHFHHHQPHHPHSRHPHYHQEPQHVFSHTGHVDNFQAASTSTSGAVGPSRVGRSFSTVSTILTSYPLRDAISILILLLSLPPTLVLVIQTLFASLTFVPPTAGLSLSTLPNIKEVFNSSNLGYPALATILIIDILFWGCWLPLWKPVQSVFLDLSQAVIAVSLSGAAASSSGGPTYSVAACSLIVCVVHVLRHKAIHLTALDYLRSVIHKIDWGVQLDVSFLASSFQFLPPADHGWIFTVVRTVLGIHIVSQGVTTCIRRSLVKANERDLQAVPTTTRADAEAVAGDDLSARSSLGSVADGASSSSHSPSSVDSRLLGLPPAHRDSRLRELSTKKKRKQANQVRSQQPLWAAIASTKVTFVKEMEQRDAADDSREALDMDRSVMTTTLANKSTTLSLSIASDRIWVCDVRDTEVYFCVELTPESLALADRLESFNGDGNPDDRNGGTSHNLPNVIAGIDRSKPFYVRINGAAWSSARIVATASGSENSAKSSDRYIGEVFGLAPLGSYHCEIVSMANHTTLCSTSLITLPAPTTDQQASVPLPPPHPALRPSSPITTLKQSIQSAETKLAETRTRTRKSKKDQRAAHSDIKKEINALRAKLESSGGLDDKQERRLQQISQHKSQAEEATADLKGQLELLGEMPADEVVKADARKRAWQAALDAKDAATHDYISAKLEKERELSVLKGELSAIETRKERLAIRNAQRAQELDKAIAKQLADQNAKQKRESERMQILRERERKENELRFHIAAMDAESQGLAHKAQETYQQSAAVAGWPTPPPALGYTAFTSPPTPESAFAGFATNGSSAINANGMPPASASQPPFASQFPPSASLAPGFVNGSSHPCMPRGRSSSMLSQYSGFTENGDDLIYPAPCSGPLSSLPHLSANSSNAAPTFTHPWPLATAASAPSVLEDHKSSDGDAAGPVASGITATSLASSALASNGANSPRPEAKPFIPASVATVAKVMGPIAPPSSAANNGTSAAGLARRPSSQASTPPVLNVTVAATPTSRRF